MPELPEVEAQRKLLERFLVNEKILSVSAIEQGGGPRSGEFDDKVIDVSQCEFERRLEGLTMKEAKRKGKQLYLLFEGGGLLIHFGMTGAFLVQGEVGPSYKNWKARSEVWPPKYCKFHLKTRNNSFAFVDSRRFGRALLRTGDVEAMPPLSELAPDALNDCPDIFTFTSTAPIKGVLLDQKAMISGIGNWVADEVLYASKILPTTPANQLNDAALTDLRDNLLAILRTACDADADYTKFPSTWLFHHRWAKQTSGSKQSPIGRIHFSTVAGRTTAFLPSIQSSRRRMTSPHFNEVDDEAETPKKRPRR